MYSKIKIRTPKCYIWFNRIFLIICSVNTFCAYLYQFICKDKFRFKNYKNTSNNFFIKNLPSIGFTLYHKKNMYYNFIPHFLTSFICTLYVYHSEEIL